MAAMMLDAKDLASELGCGVSTAKHLIKIGWVPSVLIGGLRRVRRTDLETKLAELEPSLPGTDETEDEAA